MPSLRILFPETNTVLSGILVAEVLAPGVATSAVYASVSGTGALAVAGSAGQEGDTPTRVGNVVTLRTRRALRAGTSFTLDVTAGDLSASVTFRTSPRRATPRLPWLPAAATRTDPSSVAGHLRATLLDALHGTDAPPDGLLESVALSDLRGLLPLAGIPPRLILAHRRHPGDLLACDRAVARSTEAVLRVIRAPSPLLDRDLREILERFLRSSDPADRVAAACAAVTLAEAV